MGEGRVYETHNRKNCVLRAPATVVVALLYGSHYDIHAAQVGIGGTPEGRRMDRVYSHAPKYSDEVEHTYSLIQGSDASCHLRAGFFTAERDGGS